MSQAETSIMKAVQVALSQAGARVFRNNIGALQDRSGRWIQYGLCPGSSDLIGWRSVTVTEAMVGAKAALFVACEVKSQGPRAKATPEQISFLSAVTAAGGIAILADSVDGALAQLADSNGRHDT